MSNLFDQLVAQIRALPRDMRDKMAGLLSDDTNSSSIAPPSKPQPTNIRKVRINCGSDHRRLVSPSEPRTRKMGVNCGPQSGAESVSERRPSRKFPKEKWSTRTSGNATFDYINKLDTMYEGAVEDIPYITYNNVILEYELKSKSNIDLKSDVFYENDNRERVLQTNNELYDMNNPEKRLIEKIKDRPDLAEACLKFLDTDVTKPRYSELSEELTKTREEKLRKMKTQRQARWRAGLRLKTAES